MHEKRQLTLSLLYLVIGMLILAFASVPIYNVFCKLTGFAGTVQKSDHGSEAIGTRQILIRFDANTLPGLPWSFKPQQTKVLVTTGENTMVFYTTKNLSDEDIIGTAIYNVTPDKAGKYFNKIHCFCFEEQMLKAGEEVVMPVSFFIDPKFDHDKEMDDVDTITLSYSFFKVRSLEKND